MNERFELLIRNGTIIDGSGTPRFAADIAVNGERIERIGGLSGVQAAAEIDARGRIVAPGFIDAHTHDDRLLLSGPDMTAKVSQGVTTVVAGNCGISLAPYPGGVRGRVTPPLDLLSETGEWFRFDTFNAYVEALAAQPPATNCALLVGHTTLRVATMKDIEQAATAQEIERMRELAREALSAGAIGVSTGLYYEPAAAAPTEEVIEICRPLSEFDGLYCTHMRNEADRVIDSLNESFAIGRALDVGVVISHHKVNGSANAGRSRETLALFAERMREQSIGLDCYPYNAASTILSADRAAFASRTIVTWSKPHPEFAGKDLAEVAKQMNLPQAEAVARLLPAGAIYFSMDEQDVQRILAFPPTMIGSDGLPHDSFPHPRLWATFPRVLGHYSRDLGLFPLEQAVHKMTGLTAATFGLSERGLLREGAYADITIFDAASVAEGADFEHPTLPAKGIDSVIVNGQVVWREGRGTGARPGRVLRRVG
ncbi:MAG TPA: D-aminoacylase [Burkholderiales bacterium]|nr:D-aminoacylase [Burkholderiales bacterium]